MRVLVTGGAGYIGSHTARLLASKGVHVTVLDDLSAGHAAAIEGLPLFEADLVYDRLEPILAESRCDAVIHFAGKALVPESLRDPSTYYRTNFVGGLRLLDAMRRVGVQRMVFSSTCAVYGVPDESPIREDAPHRPITPYGRSKLAFEWALHDFCAAYGLGAIALRYFNAAGADRDGEHGEDHSPETHLIPRALAAARDEIPFQVFGTDYPTPDGTCVRDYIHVDDLAEAHARAILAVQPGQFEALNLGTGRGASVREVLEVVSEVTERTLQVIEGPRRRGDPPELVADPGRAEERLGFRAKHGLLDTVRTAWRWHRECPGGYSREERAPRFGEIALKLGLVGAEDLERGLTAQRDRLARGERHQLLGLVLLELGLIDNTALIRILRAYQEATKSGQASPTAAPR